MATKPYPQTEETPCVASEPDKMVAEWLRPHTMEEIHAICDEAEADDEADRLLSSDFVYAEMERLNPWLFFDTRLSPEKLSY